MKSSSFTVLLLFFLYSFPRAVYLISDVVNFLDDVDYNSGITLHFTGFHWFKNARIEIQPVTPKVNAILYLFSPKTKL